MFKKLFFFYYTNKLRNRLKKIKKIVNTKEEIAHYRIFHNITINNINFTSKKDLEIDKNLNFNDFNISLKQFLLFRFISIREIVSKIILSISLKKKICLPLPSELFSFFEVEGVKINKFFSKIIFIFICFKEIVKSCVEVYKIILEKNNFRNENHIQIYDKQIFHKFRENQNPKDLISWLINNYTINKFSIIYCNSNFKSYYRDQILIIGENNYLPQLFFFQKIIFFLWCIFFLSKSLFYLLFNKWVLALMSHEILIAKKISMSKKIASDYFFSNSNAYYKPLWTYIAEKKGSNVVLFFYSSSFLGFKKLNKYLPNETALEIYKWKNIITWSDSFEKFLKDQIFEKKINFQLYNQPIDMTDFDDLDLSSILEKKFISIFDIPPRRECIRLLNMPGSEYRSELNGINFLNDIVSLAIYDNLYFVIKSKRIMNREYSKRYKNFVTNINKRPRVYYLSPEISSSRVISSSLATISIPWTSTAFIAKYYNKPSIFYDCTNTLDENDRGRQNVRLIKGFDNLKTWFEDLIKKINNN